MSASSYLTQNTAIVTEFNRYQSNSVTNSGDWLLQVISATVQHGGPRRLKKGGQKSNFAAGPNFKLESCTQVCQSSRPLQAREPEYVARISEVKRRLNLKSAVNSFPTRVFRVWPSLCSPDLRLLGNHDERRGRLRNGSARPWAQSDARGCRQSATCRIERAESLREAPRIRPRRHAPPVNPPCRCLPRELFSGR